jgi:hypothetical protein
MTRSVTIGVFKLLANASARLLVTRQCPGPSAHWSDSVSDVHSMARAAYKQQMPRTLRRPSQSHTQWLTS